jgi:hypothetical protein
MPFTKYRLTTYRFSGDICVNCESTAYFSRVCATLESALDLPVGTFGTRNFNSLQVIIESPQSLSDRVKSAYPSITFMHDQKFLESICRFLVRTPTLIFIFTLYFIINNHKSFLQTADILITSGSSLSPIVSMFRSYSWEPVVLEEKKKWNDRTSGIAQHYLGNDSAVLLSDGVPVLGTGFLRRVLQDKLLPRKTGLKLSDDVADFKHLTQDISPSKVIETKVGVKSKLNIAILTAGALRSFAYTAKSWENYLLPPRSPNPIDAGVVKLFAHVLHDDLRCPVARLGLKYLTRFAAVVEIGNTSQAPTMDGANLSSRDALSRIPKRFARYFPYLQDDGNYRGHSRLRKQKRFTHIFWV